MDFLVNMPVIGWAVIALVAVLMFIVLLSLIRRGVRFGFGDKTLSLGQNREVNQKINDLRLEIAEKEKNRLADEEKRKELFRKAGIIDEKTKADERRILRKLQSDIVNIFTPYIKCEMASIHVIDIIQKEFLERIDYNNVREKLSSHDRHGYLTDILYSIESNYKEFLMKVPNLPCEGEQYPEWHEIKDSVINVINKWANASEDAIKKRIEEKIEMYEQARSGFILPECVERSIEYPIKKNKHYLKKLHGGAL